MSTPIEPEMTATEVLIRQREHADAAQAKMDDSWRDAYLKAHAKGLADAIDDYVFETIRDPNYPNGFGTGMYDYEEEE